MEDDDELEKGSGNEEATEQKEPEPGSGNDPGKRDPVEEAPGADPGEGQEPQKAPSEPAEKSPVIKRASPARKAKGISSAAEVVRKVAKGPPTTTAPSPVAGVEPGPQEIPEGIETEQEWEDFLGDFF